MGLAEAVLDYDPLDARDGGRHPVDEAAAVAAMDGVKLGEDLPDCQPLVGVGADSGLAGLGKAVDVPIEEFPLLATQIGRGDAGCGGPRYSRRVAVRDGLRDAREPRNT